MQLLKQHTKPGTLQGIESFFAIKCNIDVKLFGDYNIYFFPENEPGKKGTEDERILANIPNKMISFTWGFPITFAELRENQKTILI